MQKRLTTVCMKSMQPTHPLDVLNSVTHATRLISVYDRPRVSDILDVALDSSCKAVNAPDLLIIAGIFRDSVTVAHDQGSPVHHARILESCQLSLNQSAWYE